MVVTDYDDNDTTDSDLVFHQIPNRVVIDDELHQCFDYSRKLAHYVIHKTIAPRIVHEMKQLNLLDHITLDDAKALPIVEDMLKHTLDDHNRITIEKATEGLNKYMIHLVKKD